ncbi:MAG: carbohydrate ABC transporter permease [Ardenticatenaceae bacterium]|nr:carbohydrate ABC transporter permease [Ardenticatenaceae bacterium]MCB8948516.1 carbohydrate ABC transporter permease [Ardenticatenaceae bacterium]
MTTYTHNRQQTQIQKFLQKAPVRTAVLLICFLWTLPTVGMFVSSFRTANEIRTTGWWTALVHPFQMSQWTLENYSTVLNADGMLNAFINSLIITIPATVIPITLAAFAAYAFAWMRFPGRDWLFAVVVGLLVVPLQMALIPVLRLYTGLDLNGTFLGTWLAHTGFGLPLAIYLLYSYISQLPGELFESAFIDGASHYTAFTRLVLPLSVPAIASFAIFQFLWVWNDLLVALVFLGTNPDVAIVTSRLSAMVGTKGEAWHLLTAGAFLTMIIPLIVFFSLQRYFVRGLLAGSVKG